MKTPSSPPSSSVSFADRARGRAWRAAGNLLRSAGPAAGLAIVLSVAAATPSDAVTRTEKTFGGWAVVCIENDDQSKRCSMLQSRVQAQTNRMVIVWSVSSRDDDKLVQALTVPAGVSIKEGVRLFIGETEPMTIGYEICGPRVCLATASIDDTTVDSIKASSKASASYVLGSKQLVQIDFDLDGFAEAYEYLAQQMS